MLKNILKPNLLVQSKAWQIFAVFLSLTIFVGLICFLYIFPVSMNPIILTLPVIFVIYWIYTVGICFHDRSPENLRLSIFLFRVASIITAIGILFFYQIEQYNSSGLIVIVNVGFFYLVYFSAKSFAQARMQKKAFVYDYAADFLNMWVFPLGVWFIQPKIRKEFYSTNSTETA